VVTVGVVVLVDVGVFVGVTVGVGGMQLPSTQVPPSHEETHSAELSQHGQRVFPRATSQVPSVPIHVPGATAVTHVPRLQHCPVEQGGLHG